MYKIQIEISIQETDTNKTDGRHWSFKHKKRKIQKNQIAILTRGKTPPKPLEKFNLYVTRHCPARSFLDWDNMVNSFKAIPDGLKLAGIIKNDSYKYITRKNYFPDQEKSEDFKIVIRIEEVA